MATQFPLLKVLKMKILRKGQEADPSTSPNAAPTYIETDPRRFSVSQPYYMENEPQTPTNTSGQPYSKQYSTKQSQQIPIWIVALISHALGVHPNRSPTVGTVLHILTFAAALVYIVSFFWVRTYDVMSPNTPEDILQGSMTILIAIIWTALGMYAKSLAKRLFRHPRFIKDIRMHSRTIFKINAAFLAFLLGLIIIVTNDVESTSFWYPETCELIELPVFVCRMHFVSKVIFSAFSLVWNTLIAIILISICRTHTIGVRRFIKELEKDAWIYDNQTCIQYQEHPMTKEDVCQETNWLEEEQSLEDDDFVILRSKVPEEVENATGPMDGGAVGPLQTPPRKSRAKSGNEPCLIFHYPNHTDRETSINVIPIREENGSMEIIDRVIEEGAAGAHIGEPPSTAREIELHTFPEASIECSTMTVQESPKTKQMSSQEILHKYWKMSCRLRATSCVFQRWLASLIALVIIWCIIYLLHWQYEPADIDDVIQFVIPLLLLPLLCSAFAEVNLEGVRLVKCIFPIDERLPLLRFLQMNPLQMTVFNVNLSYGTILTVVFAIFVAFTSRLIFTELQKTN